MRSLCLSIGGAVVMLGLCFAFPENSATAKGKPSQGDKGLDKAFQVVPAQAQDKLMMAAQKGQHKGQTQQKGGQGKHEEERAENAEPPADHVRPLHRRSLLSYPFRRPLFSSPSSLSKRSSSRRMSSKENRASSRSRRR